MGRVERVVQPEDIELREAHQNMTEIAAKMAELADRAAMFSKGTVGDIRIRRSLHGISQRFTDYRKTVVAEINTMQSRFPLRLAVVAGLAIIVFLSGCGRVDDTPAENPVLIEVYKTDTPNMVCKTEYK